MKIKKSFSFYIYFVVLLTAPVVIYSGSNTKASEVSKSLNLVKSDTTIVWEKMSFDERKEYMKKVVLPTMRAEFIAFDSTRFTAFNCRTCHGSGVKAGDFKMPNSRIPKLNMNFQEMAHDNPHYMEFMSTVVKPKMAALLGLLPINHETQTGTFGCQSCHMFEEETK